MAKLKVLKSIGHNATHSYLSLMNYRENDHVIGHLYRIAKDSNNSNIFIDILKKEIKPNSFGTKVIKQSLIDLEQDFLRLLKGANLTKDDIQSAIVKIDFDLDNSGIGQSGSQLERYKCVVEITDMNEKMHTANVKEWWK